MSWLAPADTRDKALTRKRQFDDISATLKDRVNIVQTGLEGLGVVVERLNTMQLIELFYNVYNPKTSQDQKLPGMDDMNVKDYVL